MMNHAETKLTYKVLLVEDNIVNQQVAHSMLTRAGYAVNIAGNGVEAIDLINHGGIYDIIFMDCNMPIMDGYEATKLIKDMMKQGNAFPAPVIALTAHSTSADQIKCSEAGMDDYITKPVKESDFARVIGTWKRSASAGSDEKPAIVKLKQLMGDRFANLLKLYIANTEVLIGNLEKALESGSLDIAAQNAHSIHSPSAQVGAAEVAKYAREIEHAAKSDDLAKAQGYMPHLKAEFYKNVYELQVYLK